MGLFGHHHAAADPTFPERVGQLFSHLTAFVHDTPAVLWAGVLGVVGGVATPIVGHVLDSRREKARTLSEKERQREEHLRVAARVGVDLRARLRRHVTLLGHQFGEGGPDLHAWERSYDDLASRARAADVIDTFGEHYTAFADALAAETIALSTARRRNAVDDQLGNVIRAYAPFLRALGDEKGAEEATALARARLRR